MRKLKLDLDGLKVETFLVQDADAQPRGTVHGANKRSPWTVTVPDSMDPDICTVDSNYGMCPPSWGEYTCDAGSCQCL